MAEISETAQAPVHQATIYYDDGNGLTWEGPSDDFATVEEARVWTHREIGACRELPSDILCYGSILRGRYIDPIGDGLPYDLTFESDPEWSETV